VKTKNARTCLVAGFDWKRQIKMNKERALERWKEVMFGVNTCVQCILNPPSDRSICSDCVSSHARERALKIIEDLKRKTGYSCEMEYKQGRFIFKLEPVEGGGDR